MPVNISPLSAGCKGHYEDGLDPYEGVLEKERQEFYYGKVLPALKLLSEKQQQAIEFYASGEKRIKAVRQLGVPYSTLKRREDWAFRYLRKG